MTLPVTGVFMTIKPKNLWVHWSIVSFQSARGFENKCIGLIMLLFMGKLVFKPFLYSEYNMYTAPRFCYTSIILEYLILYYILDFLVEDCQKKRYIIKVSNQYTYMGTKSVDQFDYLMKLWKSKGKISMANWEEIKKEVYQERRRSERSPGLR